MPRRFEIYYILDGKMAVPVRDVLTWAKAFEKSRRIVRQTYFMNASPWLQRDIIRHRDRNTSSARSGFMRRDVDPKEAAERVMVSTVFLGLDHNFGEGDPLIFETMVFNGPTDDAQDRYGSWDEAEKGHAKFCAEVARFLEVIEGEEIADASTDTIG